ncbi:Rieske 2Fe-2S domain-containing protein [Leekyejoonella antrihumi]|uniref:cytochrome bc1 complex Rieske iron-sulfur subunit n=1 Tax=Leekyejoonella antrihumi TaxID=1660198 RepID=UPI003CCC881D
MTHDSTSEAGDDRALVSLEHREGSDNLPERFQDPGLPAHIHRAGDSDEAAARRYERQVAALFAISMFATVLFVVSYFAVGNDTVVSLPIIGRTMALHVSLGVTLGMSLLCIGLGAIHWAKTLMPDTEVVEERHELRSPDEAREGAVKILADGLEGSQLKRRPLIKYTLGGALGLFAIPLGLQLVGSLGPLPHTDLETTLWDSKLPGGKPRRLMRDPDGTAIRLSDVTLGSVFHVLPEGIDATPDPNNEKLKAAVILISLQENLIKSARERKWGVDGVVAYSKICTHVGCPVGLYEQTTHHLLCPCHQSTFDLTEDCKVIFGPAKRALPQLKISVDDEGYLVADHGFDQPVGPSFWERA